VGLREFAKYVMQPNRTVTETGTASNQPKPVSSNRPASPQKPFFTPTNRPRPSRPQFTPANTVHVQQLYPNPYPYPYPYPSDLFNYYNPQNPVYVYQPRPAVKTPQPIPSASNQPVNPSVQSSGDTGIQPTPGSNLPSGTGFKSFRRPSKPTGSSQSARPASPTRDSEPAGSNNPQISRPASIHPGMSDPGSANSQGSRPGPSQSAGSNQQSHNEPPAGSSQSRPANQGESAAPSQSQPSNQPESPAPSQSQPATNQQIDFGETGQSAVVQNQPVLVPSAISNLNPSFGEVFDSTIPTSSQPYYDQSSGVFTFPLSSGPYSSNTGVSFPDARDEPKPVSPFATTNIGQAADLVSAMDSVRT